MVTKDDMSEKSDEAVKNGRIRARKSSKRHLLAEDELEITVEFLRLVNEARSTGDLVRVAATFFQQKSGCEVLGIRLKQGEDYPYYIARGFSPEFLERENHLCARRADGKILRDREGFPIYECVCGNVVCGRSNPSMPFYTAKGSFWTNSTSELVKVFTEDDVMAKIQGRCVENFESVAVICIRLGDETLGLLHINDRRKGMFSLEIIARWERLADQLAVALAKFRAEDELRKARDMLEATVEQRTAELHKSESLMAKSQEMAHIGSWELDVKTGEINRSAESYRIFGAAPGGPKIDYGDFISFIVPGDRERVDAQIKSLLETGQP